MQYKNLKEKFNLCQRPKDSEEIQNLIDILSESTGSLAMLNYPYATNFLGPLPAWPVKAACKRVIDNIKVYNQTITTKKNMTTLATSVYNWSNILTVRDAASLFYNTSDSVTCLDISKSPYPKEGFNSPPHCD